MRKKCIEALILSMFGSCLIINSPQNQNCSIEMSNTINLDAEINQIPDIDYTVYPVKYVETPDLLDEEVYCDSLEYVAMCVEAEAGNQGRLGKVYVADCILNRLEKHAYANFYEVIDEKNQFECVSIGTIDCIPSDETISVVAQELENRTNSEILYFREGDYHSFGTPCFSYKDHYFSK